MILLELKKCKNKQTKKDQTKESFRTWRPYLVRGLCLSSRVTPPVAPCHLQLTLARRRSFSPPSWASMRWSQWMVDGTATLGNPLLMNCSMAIWAVASCMATRSGRSRRYVLPRSISWLAGSSRCPYTIFSDRVRGRFNLGEERGVAWYRLHNPLPTTATPSLCKRQP